MKVFNVRIDNLTKEEILNQIELFLAEPRFHQITTINPEFILEAQKNSEFRNVLNASDLNVADGVGIGLAFWRFGKFLKTRLAGADLMLEILRLAEEKNLKIFLATNRDGLSSFEETKAAILKKFPSLKISGHNFDIKNPSIRPHKEGLEKQGGKGCEVLFCNFGAPFQELFINSQKCDTIRLAIGVGGSFEYLTGKVRRAPKWMRKIGLEWLWRLILQPKRIGRIFRAVIVFPVKVIFSK
ncbi:MAG: WecB/TagA/CpsF family glycosyltransferase [Parcubacteria group bacterium]